ncbi:polysaccharide biosynthesis tyrosine autokinase [Stieleria varia]
MIAESSPSNSLARHPASNRERSAIVEDTGINLLAALWRYRWAVLLPTLILAAVGFGFYVTMQETYRSTTRLMVESDRPALMNSQSGELIGGVPDIEILQAELFSDDLAKMAFANTNLQPFHRLYGETPGEQLEQFISDAQDQLILEPEVTDLLSAQSLVTLLHFDSSDKEHCVAAVNAYSEALQNYYNEKHKSSRNEVIRYIDVMIKQLSPKITDLERRLTEFKLDAPLDWDDEGKAINPHRMQQQYLMKRRNELLESLSENNAILTSMTDIAEQTKDPRVALNVFAQVLGVRVFAPTQASQVNQALDGDEELASIDLEKKLVPLLIERDKNAREYGINHPSVKIYDSQIATMKSELSRLVRSEAARITQLREESSAAFDDPIQQASETVIALLTSTRSDVKSITQQIADLEDQLATEKREAVKLARYEQEHEQMVRELDQNRTLMQELKETIARASLTEEESVTRVIELTKPTPAYIVGPVLLQTVGAGTLLGLLLGSGLALLLEKNANTFRDQEEITAMLGVPVLSHIPFFRGKSRKTKKGELDPYQDLSNDMIVVHQPSSMVSEAIRSFRTAVFFDAGNESRGRVIQITSPLPGDGKSTIASNLACSIAQSGKRVLAIDCDLRRPQLTDNFNSADKLGLTNVLNGECDPADAAHPTPLPKLYVMPCGPIPNNPAEALSLPVMNELLDLLREQYDYIILDTPPLLVVTDPSIAASMADTVVLTLRVRRRSKPNAKEAVNILSAVGANILGVVINNSDETGQSDGYRGYGYYRHGKYASRYYSRGSGPVANGRTSVAVSDGPSLRRSTVVSGKAVSSKPIGKAAPASLEVAGSSGDSADN